MSIRKPKFKTEGKRRFFPTIFKKREDWKPYDDESITGSHFDSREDAEAKAKELSEENNDQEFIAVPCRDKNFPDTYEAFFKAQVNACRGDVKWL